MHRDDPELLLADVPLLSSGVRVLPRSQSEGQASLTPRSNRMPPPTEFVQLRGGSSRYRDLFGRFRSRRKVLPDLCSLDAVRSLMLLVRLQVHRTRSLFVRRKPPSKESRGQNDSWPAAGEAGHRLLISPVGSRNLVASSTDPRIAIASIRHPAIRPGSSLVKLVIPFRSHIAG